MELIADPRRPLVSVVVPTVDRPALLARAVDAILNQDYLGEVECIVVFDLPQPGELPVVPLPERRTLRGVVNSRTPGLAGARNSGITVAQGELIAFCDDDDEWLPSKISRQVQDLTASARHLVSTCGIITVAEGRCRERLLSQPEITYAMLLRSRIREVHSSTLLIRRTALLDGIGLIDEELPGSYAEDYEWLLRASRAAPILVTDGPLARITMHRKSYFKQQWQTITAATLYLLERHPDLRTEKVGLARLYGRLSMAEAALGHRRVAWSYAVRSLRLNPRQHRAYAGMAIALRLVTAERVVRLASSIGKGI